jgi:hypothetical protein
LAAQTRAFGYELQKAGKPSRLMSYEKSRHGVTDPDLVEHMQRMMFDFTVETLRPSDNGTSTKSPTAPPAK